MEIYRYEQITVEEMKGLSKNQKPIIFLAGPTVRGHQQHLQPSWRFEAIKLLDESGFDGIVIVPEFEDITKSDKGRFDLPIWELTGMEVADCILFWLPRTKELIGLCTNFEIGYWIARDITKVVYGRPDNSYRNEYIDVLWNHEVNKIHQHEDEYEILKTLKETVDKAIEVSYL